jgi:predicted nuclease of restriction endonuclease-like (RecB) superfamily
MSFPEKHINDFNKIVQLINDARKRAFIKVNEELINLYWNVGKIISEKVEYANWGAGVVDELVNFIKEKNPEINSFNRRGLYRMKQFYETYCTGSECYGIWNDLQDNSKPNMLSQFVSAVPTQIQQSEKEEDTFVSPTATQFQKPEKDTFVSAVLTQITWTNHLEILSGCKSAEEKLFYLMMSQREHWSKMELRRQIKSAVFERTMLVNKIVSPQATQLPETVKNVFKDTYIFEFLNLPKDYSENDLRKALIKNLKDFILELGKGFSFIGEEYRVQVGNHDYYLDLLFYHRDLQCLVVFELKIEEFKPEFIGKMNFYLEALDREMKREHENPSIGVLLCKGKDTEVVEYAMARNISPALVADYETKLIDKKLLQQKLHELAEFFEQNIENE